MDDRKKRLLLIAGLLLLVLILLMLFWPKKQPSQTSPEERPVTAPVVEEKPLVAPLVERSVPSRSQASAEAVARAFAERYASFSAESDFANVRDLYPVMTTRFATEEEARITPSSGADEYYGVTSKIVSLSTVSFTETQAVIDAALQRVEARGSAQNTTTRYQTLRLNLVFENDSWLVDGAAWSN